MFVSAALGIKCYDEFLVSFSPSVFIVKRCQNTKQVFFSKGGQELPAVQDRGLHGGGRELRKGRTGYEYSP